MMSKSLRTSSRVAGESGVVCASRVETSRAGTIRMKPQRLFMYISKFGANSCDHGEWPHQGPSFHANAPLYLTRGEFSDENGELRSPARARASGLTRSMFQTW